MKTQIICFTIGFIVLFASCTGELDQQPITSKVSTVFYSSEAEIEEAVNGVYAGLQSNGLYGRYMVAAGEIQSDETYDEVPANDSGDFGKLDDFTANSILGSIGSIWQDSYVAVQRANVVLNRIDDVSFNDEAVKNARIGEMKFIRALVYFNLVRLYGDVPLVTQETTDPNSYFGQGRTSKDLVYNQIIQDLTEAESLLPASAGREGKVIKTATQALLGKVFMTLGDWSDAKIWLDRVKNSNVHELVPLTDVFDINKEANKEIIFSVQFASGINGNSEGSSMYQNYSPTGIISGAKGHNLPTKSLYELYTQEDLRMGTYIDITSGGVPYSLKLKANLSVPADGGSNVVVLRYADVLLMLAEVENELGNTAAAVSCLNQVRVRAGLSETAASTQNEVREAVDLERRLELVCEGHRWFDLLRTGRAIEVMNKWFADEHILITIDAHHLLLPVPLSQINTDPSIKQNPGYE
ncbi:MAG: RagB/SusD family nutrient uptake outer membrane protein [Tannerella sp.]|jgi:hypothetical protein|nr:RagB/SusD family nutrient uptake outer membrane protein [Tannerella sp.]